MEKSSAGNAERDEFTCPLEDGFFGIPGMCGPEYYQCISGEAYPKVKRQF